MKGLGGLGRVLRAEHREEGGRYDGVLLGDDGVDRRRAGLADGENVGRLRGLELIMLGELALQVGVPDAVVALDGAVQAGVFVLDLAPGQRGDLLFVGRPLRFRPAEHRLDVIREYLDGLPGRGLAVFPLERGDLGADSLRRLLPLRQFAGVLAGLVLRPGDAVLDGQGVAEETAEGVVVALQDRVELVVMAARALHAGAEEDVAGGVGHVVEDVLPLAARVAVVVFVDPMAEVAERREGLRVAGEQLIARDLLMHEAVVGLVVVVGLDDVVAVTPGRGAEVVDAEAIAVRVAHQVEPGAGHALAVGRGGEEAVDQLLVSPGVFVLQEGVHRFGRRREAGGVEGDASDQDGAVGFAGGSQALLREARLDEAVNGVGGRAGRKLRTSDGLIGPPGLFLRADGAGQVATGDGLLGAAPGPGRAGLDPVLEQFDLRRGEAVALGGHPDVRIGRKDVLQKQALGRVAG